MMSIRGLSTDTYLSEVRLLIPIRGPSSDTYHSSAPRFIQVGMELYLQVYLRSTVVLQPPSQNARRAATKVLNAARYDLF